MTTDRDPQSRFDELERRKRLLERAILIVAMAALIVVATQSTGFHQILPLFFCCACMGIVTTGFMKQSSTGNSVKAKSLLIPAAIAAVVLAGMFCAIAGFHMIHDRELALGWNATAIYTFMQAMRLWRAVPRG